MSFFYVLLHQTFINLAESEQVLFGAIDDQRSNCNITTNKQILISYHEV